MLRLNTSVGIINILLWIFTEVFIVLMTFQATRLLGRYILNRSLARGDKLQLNSNASFVDGLPYNSDLQPLRPRVKLFLTSVRLFGIMVSVYLGLTLDGEVRHIKAPHLVKKTDIATDRFTTLTQNDGNDIAAMAKLSCLVIENNTHVDLYRGYMNEEEILCEDGHHTFSSLKLLSVDIRPQDQDPRKLDMGGLKLIPEEPVEGLSISSNKLEYRKGDVNVDMVLHARRSAEEEEETDTCYFGVTRSAGQGFEDSVYLQINVTCEVVIVDFTRLVQAKPAHMPPRMSFLHQTVDALVVWRQAMREPEVVGTDVVATITTPGSIVALVSALICTVACVWVWILLKRGNVKQDVLSARGVARLWGEDKYGSSAKLFLALEAGDRPYLGSMDGLGMNAKTVTWANTSNASESGIGIGCTWMSSSNVSDSGDESGVAEEDVQDIRDMSEDEIQISEEVFHVDVQERDSDGDS